MKKNLLLSMMSPQYFLRWKKRDPFQKWDEFQRKRSYKIWLNLKFLVSPFAVGSFLINNHHIVEMNKDSLLNEMKWRMKCNFVISLLTFLSKNYLKRGEFSEFSSNKTWTHPFVPLKGKKKLEKNFLHLISKSICIQYSKDSITNDHIKYERKKFNLLILMTHVTPLANYEVHTNSHHITIIFWSWSL